MILAPQVFSGNATVNATSPVAIGANGSLWAVEVQATAAQWSQAFQTQRMSAAITGRLLDQWGIPRSPNSGMSE